MTTEKEKPFLTLFLIPRGYCWTLPYEINNCRELWFVISQLHRLHHFIKQLVHILQAQQHQQHHISNDQRYVFVFDNGECKKLETYCH